MSPPPDAPHDPASDATSRIGDILASAEREVADIIAAAERRSAAEHDARTRQLDARSSQLDERDAALHRRDAELAERAARVEARAARVQARAAEIAEITSGLLASALGVQDHAERLQGLPGLDDEDDLGPTSNGAGAAGYEPATPPTALRRRSFGPVPTSTPDPRAVPQRPASGLRSVGPDDGLGPQDAEDAEDVTGAEHTPSPTAAEPDRGPDRPTPEATSPDAGEGGPGGDAPWRGEAAHPGREVHGATGVGAALAGDGGESVEGGGPFEDGESVEDGGPVEDAELVEAVVSSGPDTASRTASDAGTAVESAARDTDRPMDTVPSAADDDRVDSPDKIDSARLVALSMAAEGRPRDDVEAYIRDELRIKDHASLIDYVFGISTPSSVVPSWPPRRRRRPS
jgi:hypothetical protein